LREIFLEAVEFDEPKARSAYLNQTCGSDGDLRKKIDALEVEQGGRVGKPREKMTRIEDMLAAAIPSK